MMLFALRLISPSFTSVIGVKHSSPLFPFKTMMGIPTIYWLQTIKLHSFEQRPYVPCVLIAKWVQYIYVSLTILNEWPFIYRVVINVFLVALEGKVQKLEGLVMCVFISFFRSTIMACFQKGSFLGFWACQQLVCSSSACTECKIFAVGGRSWDVVCWV